MRGRASARGGGEIRPRAGAAAKHSGNHEGLARIRAKFGACRTSPRSARTRSGATPRAPPASSARRSTSSARRSSSRLDRAERGRAEPRLGPVPVHPAQPRVLAAGRVRRAADPARADAAGRIATRSPSERDEKQREAFMRRLGAGRGRDQARERRAEGAAREQHRPHAAGQGADRAHRSAGAGDPRCCTTGLMPRQAALFRGINVGRNRRVSMADIRETLEEHYDDVRTHGQSGNVVFSTDEVRQGARARAGAPHGRGARARDAHARPQPRAELGRIVKRNPLAEVAKNPSRYLVTFLADKPDAAKAQGAARTTSAPSRPSCTARRSTAGTRTGSSARSWRRSIADGLGTVGTARNWNTVDEAARADIRLRLAVVLVGDAPARRARARRRGRAGGRRCAGGAAGAGACQATPNDGFGPFGQGLPPVRAKTGTGHVLTGVVLSAVDCKPIRGCPGAVLAVEREGRLHAKLSATVLHGPRRPLPVREPEARLRRGVPGAHPRARRRQGLRDAAVADRRPAGDAKRTNVRFVLVRGASSSASRPRRPRRAPRSP